MNDYIWTAEDDKALTDAGVPKDKVKALKLHLAVVIAKNRMDAGADTFDYIRRAIELRKPRFYALVSKLWKLDVVAICNWKATDYRSHLTS